MKDENINLNHLLVFGDSHARSFRGSQKYLPFFMGPGKKNCFISDQTYNHLKRNLLRVLSEVNPFTSIMFCFGEPDTRYYLGKGWQPWLSTETECVANIEKKIYASFSRYSNLINTISSDFDFQIYVLCVIPSIRKTQNLYVKRFNLLLREYLERTPDIYFIDIEDHLLDGNGCLKQEFQADPVHANSAIQDLVDSNLMEIELCQNKLTYDNGVKNAKNLDFIEKYFVFDQSFECYRYKYGGLAVKALDFFSVFLNRLPKISSL